LTPSDVSLFFGKYELNSCKIVLPFVYLVPGRIEMMGGETFIFGSYSPPNISKFQFRHLILGSVPIPERRIVVVQ